MLPFEDTQELYHYDPTDADKLTVGHTVYHLLSVPPMTKSSPADDLLSYFAYKELTGYDDCNAYYDRYPTPDIVENAPVSQLIDLFNLKRVPLMDLTPTYTLWLPGREFCIKT